MLVYLLVAGDPGYSATVQHGLIAATTDQSTGIIWAIAAYQNTSVTGTLSTIGRGSANTDKIIAQNGAGTTYAAGLARAYTGGGYSDWYLPSKDELNKLFLNRVLFSTAPDKLYWSSSEWVDPSETSWFQVFDDSGYQGGGGKFEGTIYVRAFRSF